MEVCPICNGMIEYIKFCSKCGNKMNILDRIENYYDEYSPYLSYELTDMADGDIPNVCSHFCYCPNCGEKSIISAENIPE